MTDSGYTLITGASGFIGGALAQKLAAGRKVICLSRKQPADSLEYVQGEFHCVEDLQKLNEYDISCVVHLAAATGGCSEEDGLTVNVLGTQRLLRYAIDRGCRKFVMASSIAAVGGLNDLFVPVQLPILDEHPCLARDAYGFSKAMMEEVTRYFQRITPDADFINLRLGAVAGTPPTVFSADNPPPGIPFVILGHVMLDDVLRAFDAAINAEIQPGVRVFNVVGMDTNCSDPVPDVLRAALGERIDGLDLSWYDTPGHEYDPIYSMDSIRQGLGFASQISIRGDIGSSV